MAQSKKPSTRLFGMGLVLIVAATGLLAWGMTSDATPAPGMGPNEMATRIGEVGGALGGVGLALWVVALIQKLRGR